MERCFGGGFTVLAQPGLICGIRSDGTDINSLCQFVLNLLLFLPLKVSLNNLCLHICPVYFYNGSGVGVIKVPESDSLKLKLFSLDHFVNSF